MKLQAAHRLLAAEDWWTDLPSDQKKQYIKDHPGSKYAKDAIKNDKNDKDNEQPESKEDQVPAVSPEHRKKVSGFLKTHSPKIARLIRESFPLITGATSALKHLASGKKLNDEHKDVLKDLGDTALKTALKFAVGSEKAHLAHTMGRVGVHAVAYAVEHFKAKKEAAGKKDDLEVFVDSVAEGVERAEVPKVQPIPKGAIARHIKSKAHHIARVLDRSFPHVKHATTGLVALSKKQPLDEKQKKAIKSLGKVALGMSIAALPGGFAAHLLAGAGSIALTSALNSIRKKKVPEGKILVHFVESIGQGLEDALVSKALGDGA
jgi:hypothetical protein